MRTKKTNTAPNFNYHFCYYANNKLERTVQSFIQQRYLFCKAHLIGLGDDDWGLIARRRLCSLRATATAKMQWQAHRVRESRGPGCIMIRAAAYITAAARKATRNKVKSSRTEKSSKTSWSACVAQRKFLRVWVFCFCWQKVFIITNYVLLIGYLRPTALNIV